MFGEMMPIVPKHGSQMRKFNYKQLLVRYS
jgi:hypothetical protein